MASTSPKRKRGNVRRWQNPSLALRARKENPSSRLIGWVSAAQPTWGKPGRIGGLRCADPPYEPGFARVGWLGQKRSECPGVEGLGMRGHSLRFCPSHPASWRMQRQRSIFGSAAALAFTSPKRKRWAMGAGRIPRWRIGRVKNQSSSLDAAPGFSRTGSVSPNRVAPRGAEAIGWVSAVHRPVANRGILVGCDEETGAGGGWGARLRGMEKDFL